jgi:hypothetical protein
MNSLKKYAFAILVVGFSVQAFADPAPIATDALQVYVQAVQLAGGLDLPCNAYADNRPIRTTIEWSNALYSVNLGYVESESSGVQPALTLIQQTANGQLQFIFTTSKDFKAVTQVDVVFKGFELVNHGTVVSPDVREDLVLKSSYICKN